MRRHTAAQCVESPRLGVLSAGPMWKSGLWATVSIICTVRCVDDTAIRTVLLPRDFLIDPRARRVRVYTCMQHPHDGGLPHSKRSEDGFLDWTEQGAVWYISSLLLRPRLSHGLLRMLVGRVGIRARRNHFCCQNCLQNCLGGLMEVTMLSTAAGQLYRGGDTVASLATVMMK